MKKAKGISFLKTTIAFKTLIAILLKGILFKGIRLTPIFKNRVTRDDAGSEDDLTIEIEKFRTRKNMQNKVFPPNRFLKLQ